MTIHTSLHTDHQLDQLAGQFEHWRQTRTQPRDRIPQALWDHAVALARVLPHSRVAQHVRLSANALKKQMARTPQDTTAAVSPLSLGFVEMPSTPGWPQPHRATQVELHRPDGAWLSIHAPESALPLEALVRAFLEGH